MEVTYEEAVTIAREIGESLGGRQQRALEVLVRFAQRGHRAPSQRLQAVGTAVEAVASFPAARVELDNGMRIVKKMTGDMREEDEAEKEPCRPAGDWSRER